MIKIIKIFLFLFTFFYLNKKYKQNKKIHFFQILFIIALLKTKAQTYTV